MRAFLKSIPQLRRLRYRLMQLKHGTKSEADEVDILADLAATTAAPKTFVEFGFHPVKFNCAAFANEPEWRGLLIDGSAEQVEDAKVLLPTWIDIRNSFLSLDNLDFIRTKFERLGILSIDVDGNDYWFLEKLIGIGPSIISIEYNASFESASVTVPYDPTFVRHQKHPTGWYHGASLAALAKLCREHGYGLAAVSTYGANAFFTKSGNLDPAAAWKPNLERNAWSGTTSTQQWEAIKEMPLVAV
ncbi:hypothetical protein [Bradyrhizobium hipponense]|nr:hypothetical protein [Bradyrhizobium hipponense]